MDIAIIILNYNCYTRTIECVNSLLSLELCFKIVIVDNNSTDNSYNLLLDKYDTYTNIYIVKTEKNGGYSYGNNFGIKFISNLDLKINYICIMNPDIIIFDKNIFEICIEKLNKINNLALVSGIQIYNGRVLGRYLNCWKLPNKITGILNNSFLDIFKRPNKNGYKLQKDMLLTEVVSGCFFIIKKNVFEKIGYFDENVFLYYEENILSAKLKKNGYQVALIPNCYFMHNHTVFKSQSVKKIINEKKNTIKSKKYFYKNYISQNIFLNIILRIFNYVDFLFYIFLQLLNKFLRG